MIRPPSILWENQKKLTTRQVDIASGALQRHTAKCVDCAGAGVGVKKQCDIGTLLATSLANAEKRCANLKAGLSWDAK